MLDELKYQSRQKIVKCVEEGISNLNPNFNQIHEENQKLLNIASETQSNTQELRNIQRIYDFVSPEYILDTIHTINSHKPRVLIMGFYGGQNLGDELMLQALLKRLQSKNVNITIMLARHLEIDASIYAPHEVIHYPTRNDDILLLAKNYDYIIWGGGAVLDDRDYHFEYLFNNLQYALLKTSLAALKFKKKNIILGVSTNRAIQDKNFIEDLQEIINKADFFSLRDTNSLQTLKNANIDTSPVKIIDDLAIPDIFAPPIKKTSNSFGMVFIIDEQNLPKIKQFIQITITIISKQNSKSPFTFHFIPFYTHENSDRVYFENIAKNIQLPSNSKFTIEPFPGNMPNLINILSECKCVFSMRYHATLIATLLGIKTLSIDYSDEHVHYHNKLSYIAEHYGKFEKISFKDIDNPTKVHEAIKKTLSQKPSALNPATIKKADDTLTSTLNHFILDSKKQ